jgi:hypothetical protein
MAKNKSVYEIMGSADDIIRSDDYQVHARANPQDHYVTPKSAATRLAEDKGYKQRQLNAAILGSVGQLMQQAGQFKEEVIDKPQIEMDTYNLDQQASKDTNAWETWKVQNQSTYEAMSPDERNARRSQAYAGSNELAATMHKDVQLKWGSVFSRMAEKETLGNIPKDFQRLITLKTNNIFEEFAALTVGDDGNPITQEAWNNKLNARLLNFQANHKLPMKDINKWIGESAINSLNSDDERWFNYAESRQMFNTAEFINDGVTARKQTALDQFRKRVAVQQKEDRINVLAEVIASGDSTKIAAAQKYGSFNDSEERNEAETRATALLTQADNEALQEAIENPNDTRAWNNYQLQIQSTMRTASMTGLEINSHGMSIQNAARQIGSPDSDPVIFKQGLATWRAYNQINPQMAEELAGASSNDMVAFDILSREFGDEKTHAILMRPEIKISEKERIKAVDFQSDDDIGFTSSSNLAADQYAFGIATALHKRGYTKEGAMAAAKKVRDSRFRVVREISDNNSYDYTFRFDTHQLNNSLADFDFLTKHGIDDPALFKEKLISDTIPRLVDQLKDTFSDSYMDEGDDFYLQAHPNIANGGYYLARSSGEPVMSQSSLDAETGEVIGENMPIIITTDDLAQKSFEFIKSDYVETKPKVENKVELSMKDAFYADKLKEVTYEINKYNQIAGTIARKGETPERLKSLAKFRKRIEGEMASGWVDRNAGIKLNGYIPQGADDLYTQWLNSIE